jgi:hypothetical protein
MEGLIEGRIVHYVLTKEDAKNILQSRLAKQQSGNYVEDGMHFPMIIVRVWSEDGCVNGKVELDGEDSLWVCSKLHSFQT